MQAKDEKMKQVNHIMIVHLIISGSQIILGEEWTPSMMIGLHQAIN
jgi:hypothetical protein